MNSLYDLTVEQIENAVPALTKGKRTVNELDIIFQFLKLLDTSYSEGVTIGGVTYAVSGALPLIDPARTQRLYTSYLDNFIIQEDLVPVYYDGTTDLWTYASYHDIYGEITGHVAALTEETVC